MEINESEIGDTPVIRLEDVGEPEGVEIYAKVEWFNLYSTPYGGGSVKSRPALYMIREAEDTGGLTRDKTVIEPTSGNTGSEIAKIARSRGYDVLIVMPDNAGEGKINTVRESGGQIEFTDAMEGYDAVIERAHEIYDENPSEYYMPDQYSNPMNPESHQETTAPEIYDQVNDVTHFVTGVGTGGTVTGVSRGLKDRDEDIEVFAMEPDSALHAIDGLKYIQGEGHIVPEIYDDSEIDGKIEVSTDDAYDKARMLRDRYSDEDPEIESRGQHEKRVIEDVLRVDDEFLVGTSSGANLQAAIDLGENLDEPASIVTTFCDRGDKYKNSLWRNLF